MSSISSSKPVLQYSLKLAIRFAVACLLYLSLASILRYQGPLTLPHVVNKAKPQHTLARPPKVHINNVDKKWEYNFADFPNGALHANDWNFETGSKEADYNNEAETYTRRTSNVRIENGMLVIEAKPENLNGKSFTSARINTKGKFKFTYGTLEADMMLPAGIGTWPAAWLMPSNNIYRPSDYGIAKNDKFAWALNGEIDFAEAIGSLPGQNIPAAHSYNEVQSPPTYTPGYIDNPHTVFHRYGVIKTPDKITFTLDGKPYASREKTSSNPLDWPYDQPYYLIINLAVGGNWAGANGIDTASAPWQLKIKSLSYTPL